VSPIFNFQQTILNVWSTIFKNFDKTLFYFEGGSYTFTNLSVSSGKMTWMPNVVPFMVDSIVFDVSAANLTLTNSVISGIFSNYSSPVIYIVNDPAATSTNNLVLLNSTFANNIANLSAGVIFSSNINVTIDRCIF
jgi:hypothetical protein